MVAYVGWMRKGLKRYTKQVSVALRVSDLEWVRALAEREEESEAEIMRRALAEYRQRREAPASPVMEPVCVPGVSDPLSRGAA